MITTYHLSGPWRAPQDYTHDQIKKTQILGDKTIQQENALSCQNIQKNYYKPMTAAIFTDINNFILLVKTGITLMKSIGFALNSMVILCLKYYQGLTKLDPKLILNSAYLTKKTR